MKQLIKNTIVLVLVVMVAGYNQAGKLENIVKVQ
jgi:hypothetical protein